MVYAQFYQKSAINSEVIEACGDRSVIILDGRNSLSNWKELATKACFERDYLAFSLHKGVSFNRSVKISNLLVVKR